MTDDTDRSSFDKLSPLDRRAFLGGLLASAAAAGLGLPLVRDSYASGGVIAAPEAWQFVALYSHPDFKASARINGEPVEGIIGQPVPGKIEVTFGATDWASAKHDFTIVMTAT